MSRTLIRQSALVLGATAAPYFPLAVIFAGITPLSFCLLALGPIHAAEDVGDALFGLRISVWLSALVLVLVLAGALVIQLRIRRKWVVPLFLFSLASIHVGVIWFYGLSGL